MLELPNGERWQRWVPVPIRMILGVGFMAHGWAKWSRGPAMFAELLKQAHVPLPLANAWLVTLLEIFGGLALLIGAFVTIVSVPLILSMLGAMFTVNIKYGFSAVNTIGLTPEGPQLGPPGYEINLLYIACLVVLILSGAGPLSIRCAAKSPTAAALAADNRYHLFRKERIMNQSVAIVTGASQGIGRSTAVRLARDFSAIVLVARNANALTEVAEIVKVAGAKPLVCDLDLSKVESAETLINKTLDRFGRIDALLNIAGAVPQIDLFEMTDEQWRAGTELKLHGARRLTIRAWEAP